MDGTPLPLPTFTDVLAAAARIAPHAQLTPVLRTQMKKRPSKRASRAFTAR